MPTPCGYHGCYLRVDLSTCDVQEIPLAPETLRFFVGGAGLGTWLLHAESADGVDPLAAEAPLAFIFSPLVGSPLTTSAKFAVMAKSPLTGRINDSLSSSHFAISGKKTGHDAIVVVGRAERPTCLVVDADRVTFADARDAWGLSVPDAERSIRGTLGKEYRVAVIGPAGEAGVRFATISHDGRHAGRGGLGAVMGAKRLKAVAVRGSKQVPFGDPDALVAYSRELSRLSFGPATAKSRELGTMSNLLVFNRLGTLPTHNFQRASFPEAERLAPETIAETHPRTRESCAACTIGCEHIFQSAHASGGVRMEYENLYALGPLCGISDPDAVLEASAFCDTAGMDTISAGATVAFAMECAERGLIKEDKLRFGNAAGMMDLLRSISRRSEAGELFSLGTRAAAAAIGQGSEDFAPHVKGLEIPGYEPRALQTMALGFAVGTRGADHNRSGAYQVDFSTAVDRRNVGPEAAELAVATENEAAVMDSLILCKFLRGVFDDRMASMAEMLRLVTGWDVSADELCETARRIVTAKKWYNIRQGWTPAEDTLPKRLLSEPLTDGASQGASLSAEHLRVLVEAYNQARGWSAQGWIPESQLAELKNCGIPVKTPG